MASNTVSDQRDESLGDTFWCPHKSCFTYRSTLKEVDVHYSEVHWPKLAKSFDAHSDPLATNWWCRHPECLDGGFTLAGREMHYLDVHVWGFASSSLPSFDELLQSSKSDDLTSAPEQSASTSGSTPSSSESPRRQKSDTKGKQSLRKRPLVKLKGCREGAVYCRPCHASFLDISDHNLHYHRGTTTTCPGCNRKFANLLAHVRRAHIPELQPQCPHCPKKYSRQDLMKAHCSREHQDSNYQGPTWEERGEHLHCQHCNKSLSSYNARARHFVVKGH